MTTMELRSSVLQDIKEGKAQLGTMEDLYSELEAES